MKPQPEIEVLARGVLVRGESILLCRTRGADNTYLPGGHVEFNEPAAAALRREIREELGETGAIGRFLGAVEHAFVQAGLRHCEVNLVFEISLERIAPAEAVPSREARIGFEWARLRDLPKSGLEPAVLRVLLPEWLKEATASSRWASTYERKGDEA